MSYVMIGTYMTRLGDPSVLYDYLITQIRLTLFYRMSNPLPIHQDDLSFQKNKIFCSLRPPAIPLYKKSGGLFPECALR